MVAHSRKQFAVLRLPEGVDDEIAIMQLSRTDISQFAPLYERYAPQVYGYCLRRVGNPQEAEDLTSTIFTNVLTNVKHYRGGMVSAWIFRIAHNAVVSHLRVRRAQVSLETVAEIPHDTPSLIEDIIENETYRRLRNLVAALPEDQQNLLAMRIAGKLNSNEIGEVFGKSRGAIRVALHRIIERLRSQYHQEEQDDD